MINRTTVKLLTEKAKKRREVEIRRLEDERIRQYKDYLQRAEDIVAAYAILHSNDAYSIQLKRNPSNLVARVKRACKGIKIASTRRTVEIKYLVNLLQGVKDYYIVVTLIGSPSSQGDTDQLAELITSLASDLLEGESSNYKALFGTEETPEFLRAIGPAFNAEALSNHLSEIYRPLLAVEGIQCGRIKRIICDSDDSS
jgi:hypothetical protein